MEIGFNQVSFPASFLSFGYSLASPCSTAVLTSALSIPPKIIDIEDFANLSIGVLNPRSDMGGG